MNSEDEEFERIKQRNDMLLNALGFPTIYKPKCKLLTEEEIQAVADEVQFGYHSHYDKEFVDAIQEASWRKNENQNA